MQVGWRGALTNAISRMPEPEGAYLTAPRRQVRDRARRACRVASSQLTGKRGDSEFDRTRMIARPAAPKRGGRTAPTLCPGRKIGAVVAFGLTADRKRWTVSPTLLALGWIAIAPTPRKVE